MNQHLSMRSGNPALNSKVFNTAIHDGSGKMTIEGTVNKTALSLIMLMITALYSWANPNPGLMILGGIGGFIMAIITFLIVKLAKNSISVDESNKKLWKIWGIRTAYWEGVIVVSGLGTALICYLLKSLNVF